MEPINTYICRLLTECLMLKSKFMVLYDNTVIHQVSVFVFALFNSVIAQKEVFTLFFFF